MTRRVLVCGGRDYANKAWVSFMLDATHKSDPISIIIEGGATGADRLAKDWAIMHDIDRSTFPADWNRYGKSAGPIRNQQMLIEGKPDLVIAFPGGKGTAHMRKVARAHGVQVVEARDPTGNPPETELQKAYREGRVRGL